MTVIKILKIKLISCLQEAVLKTGKLVINILLIIQVERIALCCQISLSSILTRMVPNYKWNGASFTTPTLTSVARVRSEKCATSNE